MNDEWRGPLADYLLACCARNMAKKSLASKEYHLGMFVRHVEVGPKDFGRAAMRQYMVMRQDRGLSEKTLREDVLEIRSFFHFLRDEGYIGTNPLAEYKLPKAAKPHVGMPSAEDLGKLLSAVRRSWDTRHNPRIKSVDPARRRIYTARDSMVLALLIETGARAGEILALRIQDVKINGDRNQGGEVVIRESKGDEPRVVPVGPAVVPYLDAWLGIREKMSCESDLLVITCFGTAVSVNDLGQSFRRYCRFAGLSGFSLHGIRHYAITQMAKTDVLAASTIAGHKSLIVTRGYIHADADHVRKQHRLANPLGRVLSGVDGRDGAPAGARPRIKAF